jgi:hypothetical protein
VFFKTSDLTRATLRNISDNLLQLYFFLVFGNNFVDQRRPFSRYSSLANRNSQSLPCAFSGRDRPVGIPRDYGIVLRGLILVVITDTPPLPLSSCYLFRFLWG